MLCSEVMCSNRAPTSIWIQLWCNLLLFQLFQKRCKQRPRSIKLIASNEQPSFSFYCVQEEPLISIWYFGWIPWQKKSRQWSKPLSKIREANVDMLVLCNLKGISQLFFYHCYCKVALHYTHFCIDKHHFVINYGTLKKDQEHSYINYYHI